MDEHSRNSTSLPRKNVVTLVPCVSAKLPHAAPASDLYVSPLFRKSRILAEHSDRWYVVSAKHGLVDPGSRLEPYDVTLASMTAAERGEWARRVRDQLAEVLGPDDTVLSLGGRSYSAPLLLGEFNVHGVVYPLGRLPIGKRLQWLDVARPTGRAALDLERFYCELARLARFCGGPVRLGEARLTSDFPSRGVYFFFEDTELRRNGIASRVVRVGTHAVSKGSSSTLWNRLRTHRGTDAGGGSHRSSIFRLHVGNALMDREPGRWSAPAWGVGGSADKPTREAEGSLELEVSRTLRSMSFLVLDVSDEPSASSDRSYIERNSIAILTQVGRVIDPSSPDWLGAHSDRQSIRSSGLWNLDHVGVEYDPTFLDVLSFYVDVTLGIREAPSHSIAHHSGSMTLWDA